jgi:hypothetical protein
VTYIASNVLIRLGQEDRFWTRELLEHGCVLCEEKLDEAYADLECITTEIIGLIFCGDTVTSDKHVRPILTEISMAHKAIVGMGI